MLQATCRRRPAVRYHAGGSSPRPPCRRCTRQRARDGHRSRSRRRVHPSTHHRRRRHQVPPTRPSRLPALPSTLRSAGGPCAPHASRAPARHQWDRPAAAGAPVPTPPRGRRPALHPHPRHSRRTRRAAWACNGTRHCSWRGHARGWRGSSGTRAPSRAPTRRGPAPACRDAADPRCASRTWHATAARHP